MKHSFILCISIFITCATFGQSYSRLSVGSKITYEHWDYFLWPISRHESFEIVIAHDTILNGQYAYVSDFLWYDCDYEEVIFSCDSNKYKMFDYEDSSFKTLIDFDMQLGDTHSVSINMCRPEELVYRIDSVKTIEVYGEQVKAFYINYLAESGFEFFGWAYNGIPGASYIVPMEGNLEPNMLGIRCVEDSLGSTFRFRDIPCDTVFYNDPNTIEELTGLAINVYPNPSSGKYMLNLDGLAGAKGVYRLKDINGRVLMSRPFMQSSVNGVPIDITPYAEGVYLLEVQVMSGVKSLKLIKR